MTFKTSAALLALTVGLLQGCAPQAAGPVGSRNPVYSTDLQGKARLCTVPAVKPVNGQTVAASMVTGGGGWCGLPVENGTQPFAAGLVVHRPEKGKVYVHSVGDDTRIDYIPAGAPAADSFTVKLIPGDAEIAVSVQTATAGAAK